MAPNDYHYSNHYAPDQRAAPYSAYAASQAPNVSSTSTSQPTHQNHYAGYGPQHAQNDGSYSGYQRFSAPNTYHSGVNGQSGLGNLAYASSLNASHAPSGQVSQHSSYIASRPTQTSPALAHPQQPGYPTGTSTAQGQATSYTQRYADPGYQSQRPQLPGAQLPRAGSPAPAPWLQQQVSGRTSSPKSQTANAVSSQTVAQTHVEGRRERTQSQTSETQQSTGGRGDDRSINQQHRVYSPANGLRAQTTSGDASNTAASYPPVTVDPSQVYDPYHEYQRQARRVEREEAKRIDQARREKAQREEEAKKAEEVRRIDEARKAEEQGKAEEARRIDEARKAEEQRKAEEKAEEVRKGNQIRRMSNNLAPIVQNAPQQEALSAAVAHTEGNDDAEELKAIFEKMRKLHEKNPVLLASMWEQERKSHQDVPQASGAAHLPVLKPQQTSEQTTKPLSSNNQVPSPAVTAHNSAGVNGASAKAALAGKPIRSAPAAVMPQQERQSSAPVPRPTKAGTIWPADKKATLAAAAASLLKEIPENKGKPISADKICLMLDSNPSYIDLCERLEGLGIRLDRALFARALLQAVPDVNYSAAKIPAPTTNPTGSTQRAHMPPETPETDGSTAPNGATVDLTQSENGMARPPVPFQAQAGGSVTVPATTLSRPPAATQRSELSVPYRSPYFHSAQPINQRDSNAARQRPFAHMAPVAVMAPSMTSTKAMPRPPAPGWDQAWTQYQHQKSKLEMAKKRSFGEIVDLTQALSDDEATVEPLAKRAELEQNDSRPSEVLVDSGSEANQVRIPSTAVPVAATTDDPLRSAKLVEPLDKAKARRRSRYNPLTIARDVLLATGRHPDMRALNEHLEPLKAFRSVTNDSDLSTFRWDLVDPGEPTPIRPAVPIARIHENEDADDEADDLDDVGRVSAPSRVQQPVAMTNGGVLVWNHVTTSASFSPVKALQKRRVGRPPRHSDPGVRNRPYGFGNGNSDSTPANEHRDPDQPSTPSGTPGTNTGSSSRGAPQSAASQSSPARTGTGYAAFRQQMSADGTPLPRKKGRPVGWRKTTGGIPVTSHIADRTRPVNAPSQPSRLRNVQTPQDGIEVIVSSQSPSRVPDVNGSAVKRRGRPPRNIQAPEPSIPPPEPVYQPYRCEWKNCFAELHNLDTLRKHVNQIHGKKANSGEFLCLWGTCRQPIDSPDRGTSDVETTDRPPFRSIDKTEWETHIEKEHINPIAWELGDGLAAGLSDHPGSDLSETYLSDSQGRQVTPRVTLRAAGSTPEAGEATLGGGAAGSTAARQNTGIGRGGGAGAYPTPEEKAREDLRRLKRKKRMIGPGIDRGGARLANDKRRAGFIDDEDFEMEVEPDDD